MQIGVTDIIAGKALTDQGSGVVKGDAEIFAGLVTNGLALLDPSQRPGGKIMLPGLQGQLLNAQTSIQTPTDGSATSETAAKQTSTGEVSSEVANEVISDAVPAALIDPALIQNPQLAAIFSGLGATGDAQGATPTGTDALVTIDADGANAPQAAQIGSQLTAVSGGVQPSATKGVAGTAQTDLTVPGLVDTLGNSAEAQIGARIPATAKTSGIAGQADGKSSLTSLLTDAGIATTQTNVSDLVKVMPTGQADTKLAAMMKAGAAPADMSLMVDGDAALMGDDSALSAELDAALNLKADAKPAEMSQHTATRALSSSHMAAVVSRVSEQFLERFNGKTSTFEIRLDPPELGKVDVRVEVGRDGKIMAVIAARDPAVADALMRGAKTLENALTQAGLTLAEGGVRVEIDQKNGSGFSGAYSDEFADSGNSLDTSDGPSLAEAGDDTSVIPVIESWSRRRLDVTA